MNTLFDAVNIGGVEIKNRVVMTPMGFPATDPDCGVSQQETDYYVERARGGFGLVFPPCNAVTSKYETVACINLLTSFTQAVRLAEMIEKLHHYGSKVCIQLSLGMGRVSLIDPFTPPYSASETSSFWFKDLICKPLSKEQIADMVHSFGYAAFMAKRAGADMVELHAYGGYLIDQFLTPLWNTRTDEYGGSLENRMRILFELRDAVRARCGNDFPIVIKFTPDHGFEGGRTIGEGLEMLKILDESGFALLHLDYGAYESRYNMLSSTYVREGMQLDMVKRVKELGLKTPILAQGKLDRPETAAKVVEDGLADLVGLGHGSIVEPHWPNKVQAGKLEDVRPCLGCNECMLRASSARPIACAVNPTSGAEGQYQLLPAKSPQKVLVIGGGPGGCMAALTAAEAGHDVELWEKSGAIGGAVIPAAVPSFKQTMNRYVEYLDNQMKKSKARAKLNHEATVENIQAYGADVVILAAGGDPITLRIPGVDGQNVHGANEVLLSGDVPGERVVVIGGGLVGTELALMLDGMGKQVTVVEMLDKLMAAVAHGAASVSAMDKMIRESSLNQMLGSTVTEIRDGSVVVSGKDGESIVPCDSVVMAVGYRGNKAMYGALKDSGARVYIIGDNAKAGKIIDATSQAYHTIRVLDELR